MKAAGNLTTIAFQFSNAAVEFPSDGPMKLKDQCDMRLLGTCI